MSNTDLAIVESAFGAVGFGEFANDIRFPYLSIVAKNSNIGVEGSAEYIEGLKPGFFYNSLTKRAYGKSVKVIILDYETIYKEYTKDERGRRKDFVRQVPSVEIKSFTPQQLLDYTRNFLPSGNLLETYKQFHIVLPEYKEDGILKFELGVGSFSHARNWGNMILRAGIAYPAHVWEVSSGMMSNKAGDSWFSIGDDKTTFVKNVGLVSDKQLIADVKDSLELVLSIKNSGAMRVIEKPAQIEEEIPY